MASSALTFHVLLCFCVLSVAAEHQFRVPVIQLPHDEDAFYGTIREDQRTVELKPKLLIVPDSGPVCSYEADDVPFAFEVLDKTTGALAVHVRDGAKLDCKKSDYRFRLTAVRCDTGEASDGVDVHVKVQDTNDHTPEFDQPWYTVEVDEGKLYDSILRLTAADGDCGHPYGDICRYEITNALDGIPFAISDHGVLRNIKPLVANHSHSHVLSIVAHDCGMRKSKPTLVTVKVRDACVAGINDMPDRIEYYPGSSSKYIAENVGLKLCDIDCEVEHVEATVSLETGHIGRGCDRDTDELKTSCGLNAKTVELLPKKSPKKSNEEDSDNEVIQVEENTDQAYEFDGETGVAVPVETAKSAVPRTFTLSFWMRHRGDAHDKREHNHKQNILCSSDDHGFNRHHFSVYIKNCKLELLMRREFDAADNEQRSPAEWRWGHLPEVCDNQWHHYTVSFDFPNVDLVIDGRPIAKNDDTIEILDDWPMHKAGDFKTRLTVGACWHGRSQRMSQAFAGQLSTVLYLPGAVERPGVMQCLHQCKEQLEFKGLDKMVPGESAVFNGAMSVLHLKAQHADDLAQLLRKVSYVNLRRYPTPGHRGFTVDAKLKCKDKAMAELLPQQKGYIFVQKAPEPVLALSGPLVESRTQEQVRSGTAMLPNLKITVTQADQDGALKENTGKHKLDWCVVHMKPTRDMDKEYFSSPAALIASLDLDFEHDTQGLRLSGIEKVKGYAQVLTQIHYFNTEPQHYPTRDYTVQCSMLNGRILSNMLTVSMDIVSNVKKPETAEAAPRMAEVELKKDEKRVDVLMNEEPIPAKEETFHIQHSPLADVAQADIQNQRLRNILDMDLPRAKTVVHNRGGSGNPTVSSFAGSAVAMVIVACVGFLVVLLVVGVLRMRAAPAKGAGGGGRRRYRKSNGEMDMEWDDAGMNITVNPLDDAEEGGAPGGAHDEDYSDEESSDGESFHDDATEDDEEDADCEKVLPHVVSSTRSNSTGLEWDDSTLNHQPATLGRTQRV